MVDYYPILARAVSGLATNGAQARQELFEHARTVLIAHLKRQDPQISAAESIAERIAFEAAILRLEAEWRSTQNQSSSRIARRSLLLCFVSLRKSGQRPINCWFPFGIDHNRPKQAGNPTCRARHTAARRRELLLPASQNLIPDSPGAC